MELCKNDGLSTDRASTPRTKTLPGLNHRIVELLLNKNV